MNIIVFEHFTSVATQFQSDGVLGTCESGNNTFLRILKKFPITVGVSVASHDFCSVAQPYLSLYAYRAVFPHCGTLSYERDQISNRDRTSTSL